jgi:hypothetical protein
MRFQRLLEGLVEMDGAMAAGCEIEVEIGAGVCTRF